MSSIRKIVIIGAGNLATNLAVALHNNGIQILQIVNRTLSNAALLAEKVNSSFTSNFDEINLQADMYIIAVFDSCISEISQKLKLNGKLVVHTSGSIDMEILSYITDNYGVFYPLQTFSKTICIPFDTVPICIEANSLENERLLIQLGQILSKTVRKISSEQRRILHVSAVFACNFTSYMYLVSHQMLDENHLSFDLLKPLIERTAEKIKTIDVEDAVTGPARRNDKVLMMTHLQLLNKYPDYYEIYDIISRNITKHFYKI